ncbi:putative adenylate kinase/UMP-CMP kinase [Plasmopara halstedii]
MHLLICFVAGVGVVLDDVYPSELAAVDEYDSTFTADYLVALTASPSEVEYQLHTSELAPISGRLYSARELAVLRATSSDVLLTQSFADSHGLPEKLKVGAGEIDSLIARDNKGNKVDVLTEENDQSVNFDSPQQTVLPPDLNFEIGNDIELSNEHTLPFGTLKMVKVGLGYHKYLKRIQRELSIRRAETTKSIGSICHLVVILANQSFGVIQHHSIQAITGSLLGLSRFSTSREACSVALPEEIKRSSRNEQVKWLLYGDWNPLIAAEAANSFARLPRRDAHRRLLSKWREFCPVLSTLTNKLSHGEPEFAACYSGRVYLLSSQDARRDFCACPLQYLSQDVPVPSTVRNMWLITTENVKSSYTEKLGAGLHAQTVSPLNLLEISSAPMDTRLTCGQIVPSIEAAAVAAKAVKTLVAASNTSNRWMLTDLPLTRDIATILLEHDVVPDVILTLDKDMAIAQEDDVGRNTQPNEGLVVPRRHQIQTDMASTDEILQVFDFKPISITCPLFRKPSDTLVAIDRELNPLAPRLDRIKDGHMPELVDGYDPATIFASPFSESDDDKNIENASEVETLQLQIKAYAKTVTLQLQGECGRFCPVSWNTRNLLIPGLPSTICCFRQKFYTFAGDTERRAFERNPSAFILDEPFSTSKFIPWVLLLGVRGTGHNRIAAALDQSLSQRGCSSVDYINVDMTALVESAERYQQLEELKPEEARQTREINFVRSLKLELQRHMPTHDNLIVNVTAGLGPEDSRIPNPTVLEECFKHGLFPALVIPLIVSEERNERTLLTQWVANYRQDVAFTRKDGIGVNTSQFLNDSINLDDAREEESSRLHDRFTNDQEALDEAITKLRARGIRVCDPVDATQTMRQMVKQVKTIVNEFMAGQEALFERCQVVDMPMGDEVLKMLASGELLIGKHDLACPVTGRTDPSSPLPSKAVVYRDQLYFPRSREAYSAFLACPVKYVRKTSHSPKHQSTCCVVGTPFSDTTRVARELAKTLKTIYVSPENAIDWVIQCQCGSKLWSQILEIKEQQCDPLYSPDIIHEAICTRLHSSECQTCGWVLDGYQLNPHELQRSLPTSSDIDAVSQSIKADVLFVLERSFASVWNECHTKVDQSTLQEASAQWYTFRLELIDIWTRRFTGFHVRQLDTTNSSLWHVVTQAQEFLKRQQQLASEHAAALACNRAARSIGVVRTHQELQARQHSVYQTFCPVELRVGRYVNSCQSNRDLCVDFQNFTYWLGSTQNLEQFVACPEAYIGCLSDQRLDEGDTLRSTRKEVEKVAQALVAEAPVSASFISLLTVPDWIFPELKGYCPVTFRSRVDAKDWSALHHGSIFYRASYRSKVYFFVSQEARHQFCVEPSRFISQSLPVKLPPQVTLAKNYPGRLEQELGATLNEVLLALGSERPKFPQMSVRASACVYLALSLKALYQQKRDPNSYASQNEEEYEEEYQQRQARRAEQHRRKALAKRDAFVNDCRLGEKLKAASTPSHRSCGSGAMGARTVRAAQDALNDNHLSGSFDCEDVELLRHRFDAIVDGRAGEEDKALSADPHTVRMHAREAFFEYTKASAAD